MILNNLLSLHYLTFAASPATPVINECIFGGVCPETGSKSGSFQGAILSLLNYFFVDPDSVYEVILFPCQVIAGIGALYLLVPLMLDFGRQNYGININKIILLFMLMLMFANQGYLGKSLAFGNYAFIQGIHKLIVTQLSGSTAINTIISDFKSDKQKVLQIITKLEICNEIPETKIDASGNVISNPVFTNCDTQLRTLINTAGFSNPLTAADFANAVSKPKFVDMSNNINSSSLGFSDVPIKTGKEAEEKSKEIKNLLIGWRAAIAIVPDVALIAALLYFPFPLAFSFLSTSYLQAWFSALWSVGLFKFAMTIFNATFAVIEAALAGYMPQDTLDLAMGIAVPSIAIALATGSGLGLSSLVSQGVSSLSSKLTSTSSNISDANRNATPTRP
jgi:hypothetical protein